MSTHPIENGSIELEELDQSGQGNRRVSEARHEQQTGDGPLTEQDLRTVLQNIEGQVVDNPFQAWSPAQARKVAVAFARAYQLADGAQKIRLFENAGEVLQCPDSWRTLIGEERYGEPILSDDDIAALERDTGSFFAQNRTFKTLIGTLAVAAMVQGWTQTVGNGANLQWPLEFGLHTLQECQSSQSDIWIFGIVNAILYLTAGFSGMILADPLSEHLIGRRAPILVSAILVFASAIGSACSHTWVELLVNRFVMGIGMGCKATVVPVFASEVSPAHLRGSLVVNWQLFDALGIFFGFSANLALSGIGPAAWRLQIASLCLPTIVLIFLVYTCPDSPRYQMKRKAQVRRKELSDKWDEVRRWAGTVGAALLNAFMACFCIEGERASKSTSGPMSADPDGHDYRTPFETLRELRGSELLAAKELLLTHIQMLIEQRATLQDPNRISAQPNGANHGQNINPAAQLDVILKKPSTHEVHFFRKFFDLWTVPRIRRATGCAIVCMLCQQLCGVNVLIFYSSTIFATGLRCGRFIVDSTSDLTPLWVSWGIGIANFVFGLPAYSLIERLGRRWLLIATTPIMAFCMLMICAGYILRPDNPGLIVAFVIIFMIVYSPGMGPVPFTISSEVFPLEYRLVGMSVGVSTNLIGAGLLALFVPILTNTSLHNAGLLGIFAGLNVFSFWLIALFVRETAKTGNTSSAESSRSMSLERLSEIFNWKTKDYLVETEAKPGWIRYCLWPFYWFTSEGWSSPATAPVVSLSSPPESGGNVVNGVGRDIGGNVVNGVGRDIDGQTS